ncbi:MAG: hypothetical protein JNJ71_10785 [Rubrivivax sp.]|nr:hypothetical protein [Rubrivivax sp.]
MPLPECLLLQAQSPQTPLPLASEGVMRWVWESRFGAMLIEVKNDQVFVNGERVEPHARPPLPASQAQSHLPFDRPPPRAQEPPAD